MFKTRVTDMLGIKYPIIMGGMATLGRAGLVAAVSNAGGLGILISASHETAEDLRAEIRRTRELTDKPIGVNINLFPAQRTLPTMEYTKVCAEERVELVETSGVMPPTELLPILHDAGVKVMHKCTLVRHARSAERIGADMVAVFGNEGGGAIGEGGIATPILVQRASEMLSVPVVAAGGIADARGFVAALAWGAEAVVMGTRFMATRECLAHRAIKDALIQADETQTIAVQRNIQNPYRYYKNKPAVKVAELEAEGAGLQDLLAYIRGANRESLFGSGDIDAGVFPCGQTVGLVHEIQTVQQVIDCIISDGRNLVGRLSRIADL